ncbi:hypothetical protein HER10_EVM0002323 [Colletotrichum scovillei]|uniref:TAM domain methyltransferase n=1 Tax=Colletotrichum scovillei TaxID=1209932 RepID=A0A9P7RHL0_9PEZI|nr:uncharacterized protein HER10_EVM0002323 [Colletotrichum scovillei]KAF4773604.1 hypothetical protein HER10_EVM0002323 [Colletotrichum scovillei]KAG7056206.1 TAM domain methyltransferase [Colletotrichum scovillei]KAG7075646.1 TAM domain methyltransferase [Colletotrichum scovillei]KAG7082761.1 TAM domain methyltransferase [Colletotrichum scovillei]
MSDIEQARIARQSPKSAASRGTSPHNANNVTTQITPALDAEELSEDNLSVRGESVASSSTSVTSSVLQYRTENGRTYHGYKDGKYLMPNDDRENKRLDIQHNMFILTFDNQLGRAPVNAKDTSIKVGRVLDVGTGTGIWAMDFADEHPESEVLGVDLSPIQSTFVPQNVKFEIDDIEEPWTFSQPFDYIHSRLMTSSIGNWQEYIQKCFDNLNPNGYLELNEVDLYCKSDDGTLAHDAALNRFSKLWGEAAVMFGHAFQDNTTLKDLMADAGFVDINVKVFKWPSNPWPRDRKHKELGYWNLDNSVAGLEGFMLGALTRAHNWTKEEVTVFAMEVRNEMKNPRIHSYQTFWSVYGRKPTAEEVVAN